MSDSFYHMTKTHKEKRVFQSYFNFVSKSYNNATNNYSRGHIQLSLLKRIINNTHEILYLSHKVTYEAYFDKNVLNVYNISRWNLRVLAPKWLTYDVKTLTWRHFFLVLGHVILHTLYIKKYVMGILHRIQALSCDKVIILYTQW